MPNNAETDIEQDKINRYLKQKVLRKYKYMNAEKIVERLHLLKALYPEFVTLQSAQELYGFPSLGEVSDCQFDHDISSNSIGLDEAGESSVVDIREEDKVGCKNWILTIEDSIAHPVGSDSYNKLPEIFISGTMHGDETIGPTIVMELAELLLEAAYCESLPRGMEPPKETDEKKWIEWEDELKDARKCRSNLKANSIYDVDRKWLGRLVTTRRIVIVPAINALGFYRNEHREDKLDPKDDFPFESETPQECMQTIASRTISELFHEHLFQISLSFHSGTELIGYPWGNPSYLHKSKTPDERAMDEISEELSVFAGPWDSEYFPTGAINDIYGPHRGRFEDWSYSGSWIENKTLITECNPSTYGGYSKNRHSESCLRSVTFLVHTDNDKKPDKKTLGTSYGLMNPKSPFTGVVPRNIRLSLMAIDILQPYAFFTHVNGMVIEDDIVPRAPRDPRNVAKAKAVNIPEGTEVISLEWTVSGGFTIDTTSLFFAKWTDLPPGFDGVSQPSEAAIQAFYLSDKCFEAPGGRGKSRWDTIGVDEMVRGPDFSSAFNVQNFKYGDEIAVFAVAQMDKKWKNDLDVKTLPTPNWPPQSHLVNARTKTSWYHQNDNKIIQGHVQFFSQPVTLVIGPAKSVTYELSQRIDGHFFKSQQEIEEIIDVSFIIIGFALTCVALSAINYFKARRKEWEKKHGTNRPSTKPYLQVFGTADEKENGADDDDDDDQEMVDYPTAPYTDYTDKAPATKRDSFNIDDDDDDDEDESSDEDEQIITL